MKKILLFIRNAFGFSSKEANGFVIVHIIILALLLTPFIYLQLYALFPTATATDKDAETISLVLDSLAVEKSSEKTNNPNLQLFPFDPNTASLEDWIALGLSEKMAQRIKNYTNKGGKFYQKEDLMNIYGFPESHYLLLEPYINISIEVKKKEYNQKYTKQGKYNQKDSTWTKKEEKKGKETKKEIEIFINTANLEELKTLKGIGDKLAERIIKYRDLLGGFYDKSQFKEIYGLSPEVILLLEEKAILNPAQIKKINLNQTPKEVMAKHPYIGEKYASIIDNYRKQHPNIENTTFLDRIITDVNKRNRLLPYLSW